MTSEVVKDEDRPNENWPDKEFLETALREWLKDPQINVTEFTSRIATNKGDNYCSDMYRVRVRCEQREDDLIFVIKRLINIVSDDDSRMISSLFTKEEKMLGNVLPEMHSVLKQVLPGVEPFGAYLAYATPGVLVMEDLQQGGFRMAQRHQGLDMNHCSLVVHTLAQYHAASVLLMERKSIDLSVFQKSKFGEPRGEDKREELSSNMLRVLSGELKKMDGLEKYSAKMSALAERNLLSMVAKVLDEHEADDFLVVSHGDLWVNNIMFRYSSDGKPDGIRFVDLQMSSITSPCNDLQFFLTSTADETVRISGTDQLLKVYYKTLCETMAALECSTRPPTFEHLKEDFDKRTYNGMFATFNILPMVLSGPDEFDLWDAAATGKVQTAVFRNEPYKKALEWFLPLYERKGFL